MDDTPPPRPGAWKLAEGRAGAEPGYSRVDEVQGGRVVFMSVHGDFDSASSVRVARQLFEVLAMPIETVYLNLADLSFIDSAGLGVLSITRSQALHRGIGFVLHDVPTPVDRVLEISGMRDVFTITRGASGDGAEP